jgi:hypothetical protein
MSLLSIEKAESNNLSQRGPNITVVKSGQEKSDLWEQFSGTSVSV